MAANVTRALHADDRNNMNGWFPAAKDTAAAASGPGRIALEWIALFAADPVIHSPAENDRSPGSCSDRGRGHVGCHRSRSIMSELLNLIGLSTGIVLYAMLLIMVLRAGGARAWPRARLDPLLLATAVLGLAWNLCRAARATSSRSGHRRALAVLTVDRRLTHSASFRQSWCSRCCVDRASRSAAGCRKSPRHCRLRRQRSSPPLHVHAAWIGDRCRRRSGCGC